MKTPVFIACFHPTLSAISLTKQTAVIITRVKRNTHKNKKAGKFPRFLKIVGYVHGAHNIQGSLLSARRKYGNSNHIIPNINKHFNSLKSSTSACLAKKSLKGILIIQPY